MPMRGYFTGFFEKFAVQIRLKSNIKKKVLDISRYLLVTHAITDAIATIAGKLTIEKGTCLGYSLKCPVTNKPKNRSLLLSRRNLIPKERSLRSH